MQNSRDSFIEKSMVLALLLIVFLLIFPIAWLNRSRNRLYSILEQSQEAIVVVNCKGVITYANPATEKITGLNPKRILNKPLKEVLNLHHLDELPQIIQQKMQRLHTCDTLTIDNEKTIHIEMNILPIVKNQTVNEAVVILHNVTDRVRYENRLKESLCEIKNQNIKLQELTSRAESANRAKDIFLSNLSHEFRTPLNGIIGAMTLLNTTHLDPTQYKYLEILKQSTDHLHRMLSEILDLTQMETGHFTLHPAPFNPCDLLMQVSTPFQQLAQEKGVGLIVEHDISPGEICIGDPTRLQQILFHLLSNAVKFTEKGRITITASKETLSPNKTTLKFTIEDTGIGVSSDETKIVFTKFTQVDSSSTKKYAGIGHGLYFVKKLVDLMKGSIHLTPGKGKGTCVTVSLPFEHAK